ncbi:uncharacterized protein LACBIDRAFT_324303 [Laccaria bicolor S238N-H82]|uniref:Predicted protein n=1 Tax=Laccaria bicolor (strain S238N-H82 / ATCC MYA-4686) TaxID=486041 RepID=B0D1D9_LACBS|nr:uncharacterized protein LACBIDRAFT_324303 [Laccaria bicolor S238N-H82]EDR11616.1 predicted protein [Laccaria bicolor S238N-H82]|eukprot:XP_001877513.1 predicted protein [Laccaria bicolor S238N-H82]
MWLHNDLLRPPSPLTKENQSLDVAAAMLLVYDCSLTFGMEFEFVWSSPWGFMKVLYIVQRYLPFCDTVFLCLTRFSLLDQLVVNIDPYDCHIVETMRGLILTLRAWAVWERDLRLGVFLLSLFTLKTVAEIYVTNLFLRGLQFSTKPYPEYVGCFPTSGNRIVYLDWVVLMIYEAVILVLMIIPGIAALMVGTVHSLCAKGAIALSIVNVVVVCVLAPEYVAVLFSWTVWYISSVTRQKNIYLSSISLATKQLLYIFPTFQLFDLWEVKKWEKVDKYSSTSLLYAFYVFVMALIISTKGFGFYQGVADQWIWMRATTQWAALFNYPPVLELAKNTTGQTEN